MASTNFLATVGDHAYKPQVWLDIMGIRRRYGTVSPSWGPADTGTNRVIRPWIKEPPEIDGQAASPLDGETDSASVTVVISDHDEEITEMFSAADTQDGQTVMTSDIAAGGTTLTVEDSSVFAVPSDIYVERETMRVTAAPTGTTLTVTRGMYGSADVAHNLTDVMGNTHEIVVYSRPPMMMTRDATLYMSIDGLQEADAIVLCHGFIDSATAMPDSWEITVSGLLDLLSCQIGEGLAVTKLRYQLAHPQDTQNNINTQWCIAVDDESNFASSGWVQIDNELIKYESKTDKSGTAEGYSDILVINEPGYGIANTTIFTRFGSYHGRGRLRRDIWTPDMPEIDDAVQSHDAGVEVRQVISHEDFDAGDTDGVNPISAVLELLTSTGLGTNGSYDTLPDGWGAGIDDSYIDVTGLEELRDGITTKIKLVINEATDLRDWLADNIFRPFLLFPAETDAGTITLKRIMSLAEAQIDGGTTIDHDVLGAPPEYSPGKPPVSDILINANWYPPKDEFNGKIHCILSDASQRYDGIARKLEADIKTLYDNTIGNAPRTWLSDDRTGISPVVAGLISTMWDRFGQVTCPEVTLDMPLSYLPYVKVGSIIKLTCTVTPDLKNSDRGLSAEYMQVIEEGIDLATGRCRPVCWQIGIHDADYRRIAPSGKIKAYVDPGPKGYPRITLEPSEFADGYSYTYDVDAFAVGDKIILLDGTNLYGAISGATPEVATIKGINSGAGASDCWIDLTTSPTNAPSAGDYIDTASYDDAASAQTEAWAFLADANDNLGASNDEAHRRQ